MNLVERFQKIVKRNENRIIEIHSKQLGQGKDSDNKTITPPYSDSYKKVKKKKGLGSYGKAINRVTLFLTGEYHSSYKITLSNNKIEFGPDSTNADLGQVLVNRYGEEIEGLTEKNEEITIIQVLPELQRGAKKDLSILFNAVFDI